MKGFERTGEMNHGLHGLVAFALASEGEFTGPFEVGNFIS